MNKLTYDYDKKHDILFVNWGKVKESVGLFNDELILDLDKKGKVVGFELFRFKEKVGE